MITYHKPIMIHNQPDRIISGEECIYVYGDGDNWLYKISAKQMVERFYYPSENNKRNVNYADSFDESIVLSTSKWKNANDCKILMLDKKMQLRKQIDSADFVDSFVFANNCIYCLCGYNDNFFIKKYFIDSFKEVYLFKDIKKRQLFRDGETKLYISQLGDLYVVDSSVRYICTNTRIDCWHNDFGAIDCSINGNNFYIIQNGEEKVLPLPFANQSFYNYAYIDGNYLIVAIREYIENNQCPPGVKGCICHFGRSSILRYDLNDKLFLDPIDFENQTVLIDYDFDGAQYYFDGALYDHDSKIRGCKKIEIQGTITLNKSVWDYAPKDNESIWLLHHKDEFYGI